jgi:hypothetical protein
MPSKIVQSSLPVNLTSTTALPKGNAVRTSPRVMEPSSMVARIPPALTMLKATSLPPSTRYWRMALNHVKLERQTLGR